MGARTSYLQSFPYPHPEFAELFKNEVSPKILGGFALSRSSFPPFVLFPLQQYGLYPPFSSPQARGSSPPESPFPYEAEKIPLAPFPQDFLGQPFQRLSPPLPFWRLSRQRYASSRVFPEVPMAANPFPPSSPRGSLSLTSPKRCRASGKNSRVLRIFPLPSPAKYGFVPPARQPPPLSTPPPRELRKVVTRESQQSGDILPPPPHSLLIFRESAFQLFPSKLYF